MPMIHDIKSKCYHRFFLSFIGEKFTWSSPDAKAQADKTSCKPLQKYENAAMKSILDSTNMQRTSLGAVDNAEV